MKNPYEKPEYHWYVVKCQNALNDCVQVSGNPDHNKTCGRNPRKIDAHIGEWYAHGLVQEIFDIAFDDFRFRVLDGWNNRNLPSSIRKRRIRYVSRWSRTNCEFRGHTHYVQDLSHAPKAKESNAWYIETQHKKDKARAGGRWPGGRGCRRKQHAKNQTSHQHRQQCRQWLANSNLDMFDLNLDQSERRFHADRWMWD